MRFCKFCATNYSIDDTAHWVANGILKPACRLQRAAYREKNRLLIRKKQNEVYRTKKRLTLTKEEKYAKIRYSLKERNIELISSDFSNNKAPLQLNCLVCAKKWSANWNNLHSGSSCPECAKIQRAKTNMIKYGVTNPTQNSLIRLKAAKSANKIQTINHWSSNKDILCQGSFELKVVKYFNKYKIPFESQSKTFVLSDGKTYTPDFHLSDLDIFVEVKGFFYEDAKNKFDLFCKEYPNITIEVWDKIKIKELENLCR